MKKKIFVAALALIFALALFPSLALADGAYEQLKNDIASAPADGTETLVTLSGDIANFETADILTIEAGQNIVLDMNGHSITVASDFEGRPFVNNGSLTVKGKGTIDSSASASGGLGAINNHGTLVIENGTFVGAKYASGSCIRNSGSSAELYIKDGTFKGATCAIYNLNYAVIDGGTYIGSTCSQCKKIWSYTIRNHAVGAVMVINDGYFEGVQGAASSAVGKLTVNGGTFRTVNCSENKDHTAIYYALYAAGEVGKVECYINGGDFSTVGSNAAVLIGNDNKGGDGGIELAKEGISAEVIDPRTLVPFDYDTVAESVKKTGRLVVVHEAHQNNGWGAQVVSQVSQMVFPYLDAAPVHIGAKACPLPFNLGMEQAVLPSVKDIVDACKASLYR